jgi:serine protease AprX
MFHISTFKQKLGQTIWMLALSLLLSTISVSVGTEVALKLNPAEIARHEAAEGKLAYKLTTLEEFEALLGPAENKKKTNDGGMEILDVSYSNLKARFGRMREYSVPFTLLWINAKGKQIDIGQERQVVLCSEGDLHKFDPFWGFANVSLAHLDLREHVELLDKMPFDSQTVWPESDKMPEGFDPAALLEEGKNPGLGVRSLHEQGIDGRGVTIAIIDQPLLRNHREYADRLVEYEPVGLLTALTSPKMHGPPVSSIAVGKTCGVAPKASLRYFAVQMWVPDNKPYCYAIDKLIDFNKNKDITQQVRVVSISTGMFRQQADFNRWQETLARAEKNGILVVTCHPDFLQYGTLEHIPGQDPDKPLSYRRGIYGRKEKFLYIPAGNRTIASYHGPDVYTFDRTGGMSWAAPYLAGLAALAYQVRPEMEPKTIVELWVKTATQSDTGPMIINPVGFIEAVRKINKECIE